MKLYELSPEQLEYIFQNARKKSAVFLLVCLAFITGFIALYFTTEIVSLKYSIIVFFCIALLIWLILIVGQIFLFYFTSVKLTDIKVERIGKYSTEEIRKIVKDVVEESGATEQPNFFINKLDFINAFAVNILFFNFIRPVNSIFITAKCFHTFEREEIKAVLHHEMAHFNKYLYKEQQTLNIGIFFFLIMPYSFIVLVSGFFLKLIFVFSMFIFLSVLHSSIRNFSKLNFYVLEFLSDLTAARKTGKLSMINCLILLYSSNVIKKDDSVKNKLKKNLILPEVYKEVDWSVFDTHVKNGKIEPEEYDNFIEELENTINPKLFSKFHVEGATGTHPSLVDRILFLHKNA